MIAYIRNWNNTVPIDYQKLKDILIQIKSENKLEKKTDDWFEWLAWGDNPQHGSNSQIQTPDQKSSNNNILPSNITKDTTANSKKKPLDYAINLLPINEEEAKNQVQKNRLTEKLQHLDDIKFKNAFARRNSPKKMFIPLSTLTEEKGFGLNNFNSLQEIPIPEPMPTDKLKKSFEYENMDAGEISPQKLSDKVKTIDPQKFNFKYKTLL